jgi:hypothetical protein
MPAPISPHPAMELRYHAGCARALCAAIGTQTRSAEKS